LKWAPWHSGIQPNPQTNPKLLACMEAAEAGSPYEQARASARFAKKPESDLCRNNFIRAAECVAQMPGVDIVLDLFLGGGCSAGAMAYGLGHQRSRGGGRARAPELFSFEQHLDSVRLATSAVYPIGLGVRKRWWRLVRANVSSEEDYFLFQGYLFSRSRVLGRSTSLTLGTSGAVALWVLPGTPYTDTRSSSGYYWNALDALCQHRAPVDVVLIDGSHPIRQEWFIIEHVCWPRWVLLFNLNLHSGSAWVFHRLELLGYWRLELRGHASLHAGPWFGQQEVRRVRSWAIFSRRTSLQ